MPDIGTAESPQVRRLGANVFWGRVISGESAARLTAALSDRPHLFELDRGDNPAAEDFCADCCGTLIDLYESVRPSVERAVLHASGRADILFQPPFFVRYLPDVRRELETHVDRSLWSCVVYLNDAFRGGELEFATLGLTIRPRPGFGAIFPGGTLYPHRSRPVTAGCKLAMVLMMEVGSRTV